MLAVERKPMLPPVPVAAARPQPAGQRLDPRTRSYMESHLGHDFGDVRIHADGEAAAASRSLHARAYAAGGDVFFGAGQYAPDTAPGRRLLAHELAHVVQQQGGSGARSSSGRRYEQAADQAADAALAGRQASLSPLGAPGPQLQHHDDDEPRRRFQLHSSLFPALTGDEPGTALGTPSLLRPPARRSLLGLPQLTLGSGPGFQFVPVPVTGARTYSQSDLARFALTPLPPSVVPRVAGQTPTGGTGHGPVVPPATQTPTGGTAPTPATTEPSVGMDVGADVSVSQGNPVVLENTVSVFIPGDAFRLSRGNWHFDFLHQPGVQVSVSPSLGAPGTPTGYNLGVGFGATLLNVEFPRILELGLGQVQWSPPGQTQIGAQSEFHVTDVFSITVTGGFTIAPGPSGQNQAAWGPFQLGVVFHQPGSK